MCIYAGFVTVTTINTYICMYILQTLIYMYSGPCILRPCTYSTRTTWSYIMYIKSGLKKRDIYIEL